MENKIIEYYSSFDEWGRLDREPLEFQINWYYMKKYLPQGGKIIDNGAGPGKYAMELAKANYHVTLTDLTPKSVEIAQEKAAELSLISKFDGFFVRDARSLDEIQSNYFDAALMLGPLYHLQTEEARIAAIKELHRVTKADGIIFVAFRSRIQHILTSLMFPERWKPNDHMDEILKFNNTGIFNHSDEGRFTGAYFFDIADICPFMEANGFEKLELISSSSIGGRLSSESWEYWRNRGNDEMNKLMTLIFESASDPYLLGSASHLLYIGKKKSSE